MRDSLWMNFICVGLGGFLGAIARYLTGLLIPGSQFPWTTLLVNLIGCLAIGFLASRTLPSHIYLLLIPGFLGGFTTFSTFGLDTVRLFQNGQPFFAFVYVIASIVGGMGCVYLFLR